MSDSSRPHGPQPTRLLHPWDFPGKSTGVGCHCLLRPSIWSRAKPEEAVALHGTSVGCPTAAAFPPPPGLANKHFNSSLIPQNYRAGAWRLDCSSTFIYWVSEIMESVVDLQSHNKVCALKAALPEEVRWPRPPGAHHLACTSALTVTLNK